MKNIITLLFFFMATASFAQLIKIDSISIVKPDAGQEIIDAGLFSELEAFKDTDDFIVYILSKIYCWSRC